MSDRQIAWHVGVAVSTVGKYRKELELTVQIQQSDKRLGADGRIIDTSDIGKSNDDKPGPLLPRPPIRFAIVHGQIGRENPYGRSHYHLAESLEAANQARQKQFPG